MQQMKEHGNTHKTEQMKEKQEAYLKNNSG